MTREHAQEIIESVLRLTTAEETLVNVQETREWFQPYSANELRPGGIRQQTVCTITARHGNRIGTTSINRLDENSLRTAVSRAKEIASVYPELGTTAPFPGPADIRESPLFRKSIDDIPLPRKMEIISECISTGKSRNVLVSGALHTTELVTAIGTSRGFFAYQTASTTYLRVRAMTMDGRSSGFEERWSYDFDSIDPRTLSETAVSYCSAGHSQQELKPGRYDVILSHAVVADFLLLLLRQFQQKEIDTRMSFLTKMDGTSQLGSKLFPSHITVTSDPFDSALPSFPFTSTGEILRKQVWIDTGVISQVMTSPTGEETQPTVPFPSNIILAGGEKTMKDIIASTSRAVFINSVSNLHIQDPTNCLLGGVTRDGLFMIEDGKISHRLKNMRFSETPVYMLKGSDILSTSEPISGRNSTFPTLVPAIKMIGFSFLNPTDIV